MKRTRLSDARSAVTFAAPCAAAETAGLISRIAQSWQLLILLRYSFHLIQSQLNFQLYIATRTILKFQTRTIHTNLLVHTIPMAVQIWLVGGSVVRQGAAVMRTIQLLLLGSAPIADMSSALLARYFSNKHDGQVGRLGNECEFVPREQKQDIYYSK